MSRSDHPRDLRGSKPSKQPIANGREATRLRSILTRAQALSVSELLDETDEFAPFEPTHTRRTR